MVNIVPLADTPESLDIKVVNIVPLADTPESFHICNMFWVMDVYSILECGESWNIFIHAYIHVWGRGVWYPIEIKDCDTGNPIEDSNA